MTYETGSLPHRSEGDEESALESAARILRTSPRPAGAAQVRERTILRGRQERDLLAWARAESWLIETEHYLFRIEDQGEEHRVWLDTVSQRYFKVTHTGRFGFSVIAVSDNTLEVVGGTPLDYFDRLLLQNRIFGDDVKLEGVAIEDGATVALTSQPNITGSAVTTQEIVTFMTKLWFQPLHGLSLGRPGALAFYRDLDEVAAFDAHPGNFVKDENGTILPIDLILVRADPRLHKALDQITNL